MAKVSLRIYNREIETLIEQGHLDEAVQHCKHILKTYPKHLETYRLLGKAYLEGKRYKDASDIFLRVLSAVPDDFVSHVAMSIIYDDMNDLNRSIWNMERAFEVQPSNAAVQGELQRLYARRDGQAPTKIRMTRGALAHMYVQGELYPQAINEIRGVLKEDPGRTDMLALLVRAYFRAGQKAEASEICSSLLKDYSHCLDANRILTEILPGTGQAESTQVYRHRVNAMDPYSAFVAGSLFDVASVPDAAVSLERLEPGGEAELDSGWADRLGIRRGTGADEPVQPEWMRSPSEPSALPPSTGPIRSAPPSTGPTRSRPPSTGPVAPVTPASEPPSADGSEQIPDFMRQAGWQEKSGESSGELAPADAELGAALPATDIPEWIRERRPPEADQPAPAAPAAQAEEVPDWLRNLGGVQPPAATPSGPAPAGGLPHWLESPAEQKPAPAAASADLNDWLSSLSAADKPAPEPGPVAPSAPAAPASAPGSIGSLGTSAADQDAAMAWLESLAAKQGAKSEELLTQPDERSEAAPDWVKRAQEVAGEAPATPAPKPAPAPVAEPAEEIPDWLSDLKTSEVSPDAGDDLTGLWMKEELGEKPAAKPPAAAGAPEPAAPAAAPAPSEEVPAWLRDLERPAPAAAAPAASEDLPEWLRDQGEPKPKPTEPSEWIPAAVPTPAPAPKPKAKPPARPPARSALPAVPDESLFSLAQDYLKRGDVASALGEYGKLVKRSRMLDEIIFDLREALYRFPVEVTLWQMLGDAYMRANRLQDALDAYTKAEELLR